MSKDLFSKQADIYARYRPGYPPALIQYILRFVPVKNAAWDCATGNGQAAVLLAEHFEAVHATDISEKQIANAQRHPRINYSIATAEKTSFPDHSFNLVTVAQAYHWFNFELFASEVNRVLKPGGIIAVWGYGLITCDDDSLNNAIQFFYEEVVGPYWDPERKYVDEHYRTIPFPFGELTGKEFSIERSWKVEDLSGYLNSWSSVQHFITDKGINPVDELQSELQKAWPASDAITFRFPLFLKLGKVSR